MHAGVNCVAPPTHVGACVGQPFEYIMNMHDSDLEVYIILNSLLFDFLI